MKLEKICLISSGGTPSRGKSHFYGGDIPWAKISDIENSVNGILTETEEKITQEGLNSIGNRIFPKGTLLFAMYGSIGKVAITGRELATNQAILGIRPKGNKEIYLPYLKVWFESNKQKLINQGRGVALQNLSATIIRNLEVPLPSFSDQLHIANLLSKAENLITQRKQSIALLVEYLKSTFLEMFGDPVRNEKKWSSERLDKIAKLERGRFSPRPRNDPSYFNGKYPFIQTGDISKSGNRLNSFNQTLNEKGIKVSKEFKKGTIVIAIVGATIGATAILEIDVYATDSIIGIIPKKEFTNNQFLEFTMQFWKPILLKNAPEAARANINLEILGKLGIIMPPIELQTQFTQIVEEIEALKSQYQSSLQELANLYGSVSQRAFKGELNLSKVEFDNSNQEILDAQKKIDIARSIENRTHISSMSSREVAAQIEKTVKRNFSNKPFTINNLKELFARKSLNIDDSKIKFFLKDALSKNKIVQVYNKEIDQVMFKLKR